MFNIATLKKGLGNKKTISWSRGLVKSREINGRDSRSRETDVDEKIAATNIYVCVSSFLKLSKLEKC